MVKIKEPSKKVEELRQPQTGLTVDKKRGIVRKKPRIKPKRRS